MEIRIKKTNHEAVTPKRGQEGDAGYDLFAVEEKELQPGERYTFQTGISLEIPLGYVMLIWDRSGLAVKHGITTLAGVIDPNFRGEVGICLLNTTDEVYQVKKGDKIAQFVVQKVEDLDFVEVEELTETTRGADWVQSTGNVIY